MRRVVLCCGLAIVSVMQWTAPAVAAVALGGFEFTHRPKDDGAGYIVQPTNNVRAEGNMAYEVGQTFNLPNGLGNNRPGIGNNNGDGTFSYFGPGGMGLVEHAGPGDGGPDFPSPFLNQKNITMEGRFKVTGQGNPFDNLVFVAFENSARHSSHFRVNYGRRGGNYGTDTIWASYMGANNNLTSGSGSNLPYVDGEFVKMRVVAQGNQDGTSTVTTYLDRELGAGFELGFTETYTPRGPNNVNEGTQVRLGVDASHAPGQEMQFDYIRWTLSVLDPSEPLNAVSAPGCAGNLNGDSTTDGADVAIIYNAWGTNDPVADIDNSGTVDGADLGAVYNCWGQADTAPISVPEPASFGLLGLGLASLLAARRRA